MPAVFLQRSLRGNWQDWRTLHHRSTVKRDPVQSKCCSPAAEDGPVRLFLCIMELLHEYVCDLGDQGIFIIGIDVFPTG